MPNVAPSSRTGHIRRAVLSVCALVMLAGCQMDLHTKAKEVDANEMLGALLAAGLDARKTTPDGGKTWTISIEQAQTVQAIEVLRLNALPRERHESLGDLFKKEGLISSPTEERVRFLFGIEQELAQTISTIDGVMVSRVHIVLPNNDPLATNVKPSSASVFVKHRRENDLAVLVPAIKNLVVHAVEGLAYDQVTVTLVTGNAEIRIADIPKAQTAAKAEAGAPVWLLAGGVVTVLLMLLATAAKMGWLPAPLMRRLEKSRPTSKADDSAGVSAIE